MNAGTNHTPHRGTTVGVDVSLLLMRVIVGVIFAAHGAQKLFGVFDGPGLGATVEQMGPLGYLVTIGEFFGGIGLIVGLTGPAVAALGKFSACHVAGTRFGDLFIARTGYTGEDGFEVIVPEAHAVALWDALLQAGVKPAGLGARDTLRLEAGLNLYGQDMDETVTPFEAALGWTVALDEGRDFIGRDVLERHGRDGAPRQLIGLVMEDKGVLRHGQRVLTANGDGEILSGTFSPTLGKAIAFARVPAGEVASGVRVDIRGREVPVRVVRFPFVRDGKAL